MKRTVGIARHIPLVLFVGMIRAYQLLLSPLFAVMGTRCGYFPTCSHYAVESLQKYGVLRGAVRAAGRLLRCHPFRTGGVDLP